MVDDQQFSRDPIGEDRLSNLSQNLHVLSQASHADVDNGMVTTNFIECFRSALIRASINSIAGGLIPEVIAEAIKRGLWQANRAIRLATKIPENYHRILMLVAILETKNLSPQEKQDLFEIAITTLKQTRPLRYDEILKPLIPHLDHDTLRQALDLILEIPHAEIKIKHLLLVLPPLANDEEAIEKAIGSLRTSQPVENSSMFWLYLSNIAPLLSGKPLDALYDQVMNSEEKYAPIVLQNMIPNLSEDKRQIALKIVLSSDVGQRDFIRAGVYTKLAPFLSGDDQEQAMNEAVENVFKCLTTSNRGGIIPEYDELVPLLSGKHLQRMIDFVAKLNNPERVNYPILQLLPVMSERQLADTLPIVLEIAAKNENSFLLFKDLLPYLSEELRAKAFKIVSTNTKLYNRVSGMGFFIPYVPSETKTKLQHALFQLLDQIDDENWRCNAVESIVPYLTDDFLERAINYAQTFKLELNIQKALQKLCLYIPASLVHKSFAACLSIKEDLYRTPTIAALVPKLPDDLLEQLLTESLSIRDTDVIPATLLNFVDILSPTQIERCLELVLYGRYKYGMHKVDRIIEWLPHLIEEQIEVLFDDVISYTWNANDVRKLVPGLAPYFTDERIQRLFVSFLSLASEYYPVYHITEMLPFLEEIQIEQALEKILSLPKIWDRMSGITNIAPFLSVEQKERCLPYVYLDMTLKKGHADPLGVVIRGINALKGDLTEDESRQWLNTAKGRHPGYNEKDFGAIARYIHPNLISEFLNIVAQLEHDVVRGKLLEAIAPRLDQITFELALNIAEKMKTERDRTISTLIKYVPTQQPEQVSHIITQLTEDKMARDWLVVQSLIVLEPQMSEVELKQALDILLTVKDVHSRLKGLCESLPYLNGGLKHKCLAEIITLLPSQSGDRFWYEEILKPSAAYLTPDFVPQVIDIALSLDDLYYRAKSITILLSIVDEKEKTRLIKATRHSVIDYLVAQETVPRETILAFVGEKSQFNEEIFPREILEGFVQQIFEICDDGSWL